MVETVSLFYKVSLPGGEFRKIFSSLGKRQYCNDRNSSMNSTSRKL